jgi:hypothetical protein
MQLIPLIEMQCIAPSSIIRSSIVSNCLDALGQLKEAMKLSVIQTAESTSSGNFKTHHAAYLFDPDGVHSTLFE